MRPAPKLPLAPGLGWTKDFMRRQSSSRALMGRINCKGGAHTPDVRQRPPPGLPAPSSRVVAASSWLTSPGATAQSIFHDPHPRTICGSQWPASWYPVFTPHFRPNLPPAWSAPSEA